MKKLFFMYVVMASILIHTKILFPRELEEAISHIKLIMNHVKKRELELTRKCKGKEKIVNDYSTIDKDLFSRRNFLKDAKKNKKLKRYKIEHKKIKKEWRSIQKNKFTREYYNQKGNHNFTDSYIKNLEQKRKLIKIAILLQHLNQFNQWAHFW